MSQTITIYEPSTAPIRGLASAKIAAMIPPGSGYFAMIQNLRWGDNGVLTVKSGAELIPFDPSFPLPSGCTPRGFATLAVGTNPAHSFLGLKDTTASSNQTAVFWTTNMSSWKELTATSGKHGNTRLTADASKNDYETTFQVVYDRYENISCLVTQNGFDFPRVATMAPGSAAIHQPINPPSRSNNWGARLTWKSFFVVNDYRNVSFTGSPVHYTVSNSDTSVVGNNAIRIDHLASTPSGTATITIDSANNDLTPGATTLDGSDCRQLALVIRPFVGDFGVSHFLQNFKISIKAGATTYPLIDPTNTARQPVLVPADLSTSTYVVACSLDDVAATDVSNISQVILEPIATAIAPDTEYKLDILCIAATGNVPGNVSYAITYYNRDARSESYEQVLATRTNTVDALGTKYLSLLPLPNSELLYYKTWVNFQNTTTAEMLNGTDYLRVYRKQLSVDPNQSEEDYTLVGQVQIAEYVSGAWDFTQSSLELQLRGTPDNKAPEDRVLWLTSPGSFQQPIPIARCMAQAGNRLICGARVPQGTDSFPRLCASGASMPFRFSSLAFDSTDLSAAFEQEVTGENVQGFAVAAGASLGTNVMYVFTDQAVWMLNLMAVGTPTQLSREMTVGTDSPMTIAERNGRVYFLDTDRQVRLISSNMLQAPDPQSIGDMPIPISRGLVDDLLRAIPEDRIRSARGLWFKNRYYLFYSRPNNGSPGDIGDQYNSQCLIFSERANAWESRDVFDNIQVECPISWRSPATNYASTKLPKIAVVSLDGQVYLLEVPTVQYDFSTTPIDVDLQTGDMHQALWSGVHVKGLALLADDQNGRSLTGTVTYKPSSSSSSFTMSLDSSNPYQWSIQRTQTGAANGIAASVDFSGSIKGENRIYALKMEIEPREMLAPKAG